MYDRQNSKRQKPNVTIASKNVKIKTIVFFFIFHPFISLKYIHRNSELLKWTDARDLLFDKRQLQDLPMWCINQTCIYSISCRCVLLYSSAGTVLLLSFLENAFLLIRKQNN